MLQAGLFSAVTTAFIVEVNSGPKPDPNEETAALLRFLAYKADNTIFKTVSSIPQWTGPPRATVQVQAILFASLTASLFSAFLATLGKQWLNRYASVDLQPSVIECCRNQQKKLDGVASWHFENVMELVPVMLQAAFLMLGCALSRLCSLCTSGRLTQPLHGLSPASPHLAFPSSSSSLLRGLSPIAAHTKPQVHAFSVDFVTTPVYSFHFFPLHSKTPPPMRWLSWYGTQCREA